MNTLPNEPPTTTGADAFTLDEVPIGVECVVAAVRGPMDLRRRLLEMGFCNQARVMAIRRAPLGDPVEFSLRGYSISLRRNEARCVLVILGGRTADSGRD